MLFAWTQPQPEQPLNGIHTKHVKKYYSIDFQLTPEGDGFWQWAEKTPKLITG